MILENRVHIEPGIEPKQAPHLTLSQRACAVTLDCKRFECLLREILPLASEGLRNVIRQINRDLHRYSLGRS